jgi:hypothetical protein
VAQLYYRALGSRFDASYDSQSYGWGILTSLHTGLLLLSKLKLKLICDRQSVGQFIWVSGLPLGPFTRFYLALLFSADNYLILLSKASSLTRKRVCSLQWNHSLVPITILYCLIWDCVPFLSPLTTRRDYGGSILARLHTGINCCSLLLSLLAIRIYSNHRSSILLIVRILLTGTAPLLYDLWVDQQETPPSSTRYHGNATRQLATEVRCGFMIPALSSHVTIFIGARNHSNKRFREKWVTYFISMTPFHSPKSLRYAHVSLFVILI